MGRSSFGLSAVTDEASWRIRAECGPKTADYFLARMTTNRQISQENQIALALCSRCPVRQECYADHASLSSERRAGQIAGGTVWDSRGRAWRP